MNVKTELMDRVDVFIKSEYGKMFGFTERPDFFETVAILFLARYDPEIAKGIGATQIDEKLVKQICESRHVIFKALQLANDDRDTGRSR